MPWQACREAGRATSRPCVTALGAVGCGGGEAACHQGSAPKPCWRPPGFLTSCEFAPRARGARCVGSTVTRAQQNTSLNIGCRTLVVNPPACLIAADRPAPLPPAQEAARVQLPSRDLEPTAGGSELLVGPIAGWWGRGLCRCRLWQRPFLRLACLPVGRDCPSDRASMSAVELRRGAGTSWPAAHAPARHSLPLPHACTHVGWCRHGVHTQRVRGAAWRRCACSEQRRGRQEEEEQEKGWRWSGGRGAGGGGTRGCPRGRTGGSPCVAAGAEPARCGSRAGGSCGGCPGWRARLTGAGLGRPGASGWAMCLALQAVCNARVVRLAAASAVSKACTWVACR